MSNEFERYRYLKTGNQLSFPSPVISNVIPNGRLIPSP